MKTLLHFVGVTDPDLLKPFESDLRIHSQQYLFNSSDNRDKIVEILHHIYNRLDEPFTWSLKLEHFSPERMDDYVREFIDQACCEQSEQYRLNKYYTIATTGEFHPYEHSNEYWVFVLLRKVIYKISIGIGNLEIGSDSSIPNNEFRVYNEDSDWFKERYVVVRHV